MPRINLIRTNLFPYHVTTRSLNKQWFELPMPEVWQLSLAALKHAYNKHPVDIISFVLMSNHYHLLVQTPNSDLEFFMYEFNKYFSLLLRQKTQRINQMFGGRYKWTLIKSKKYFSNCYRYVYQNPIRAGIVNNCSDYPYSTLFYKSRGLQFEVPLCDKMGFADEAKLFWLNEDVTDEEKIAIKNGLYRRVLESLKNSETKRLL